MEARTNLNEITGKTMQTILIIFQILFALATLTIFVQFTRGRDLKNLLAAVTLGGAAVASYSQNAWWPLILGLALLVVYRLAGLALSKC
jgi:hypothetical protein